ncbi:MAG: SCP2 sterol-binding domain-containing protein [Oscillospiraceae bacterium]|nr:SCP2 sterol-binding domain-containing protein [Oscillospiraceae bacterium]
MKYEEIVAKAKEIMSNKDVSNYNNHLAVQINVTGDGEGVFYIEIADGKINVEPYDYNDNDCILSCSADNLIKIVSGSLDPVLAFTTGKLKINGSIEKALEFQKIISSVKSTAKKKK